jgi:ATP-binding cassette, subfamily F, member 3
MSLVIARDLSLAYGPKVLFAGASFAIGPKDRIGLVGANGTGKSSLMKVLAGRLVPDGGGVQYMRGARAGYLAQEVAELADGPLLECVLASVPGRTSLQQRLEETQAQLSAEQEEAAQLELAQTLADLHQELDHFEERYGRHRAERILRGLGFVPEAMGRLTSTLSGGWRTRAALGGLLLQDPDLLLLDEPTNHLDLPTLAWFDEFLRRSRKALVLITHDRAFLNRQVGRIFALEVEGLRTYAGDFDAYRAQRRVEAEQLQAQAARQAQRRAEVEAFAERFGAKATKARQAQSRLKRLEKEVLVQTLQERDTVAFTFPPAPPSGREVAQLTGVSKAYGQNRVYQGVDLTLLRGQKVAVVGVNGAGKSTLLKLMAQELALDAGTISFGHNVIVGYYAQHQAEALDKGATILEEVRALVPDKPPSFVRGVLGAFLFSGDEVDKPIGVLSGGERARVALAKLLLRPANLLLMDEPTNHLDLDSSEALISALLGYQGTLVFVSHNRSFLNQLATVVWEVKDQKVTPYPGNLDDYLYHLAKLAEAEPDEAAQPQAPPAPSEKDRKRLEAERRQERSRQEAPLKKEIAQLEQRIAQLEAAQRQREAALAEPGAYEDFAKARALNEAHQVAIAELEGLYARWEQAQGELEGIAQRLAGAS